MKEVARVKSLALPLLLAMTAAPVIAQNQPPAPPPPPPPADMPPPPAPAGGQPPAPAGPGQVAPTPLSNSPTPSDGPRAQQGNSPDNTSTTQQSGGGLAPADAPTPPPPPGATVVQQPSADPNQAFPPPAPKDHYPICKANQFDGCMEPGSGHGGRHHAKRHRR